jgi:hypothetical protein
MQQQQDCAAGLLARPCRASQQCRGFMCCLFVVRRLQCDLGCCAEFMMAAYADLYLWLLMRNLLHSLGGC